jgi:hypothetical protein
LRLKGTTANDQSSAVALRLGGEERYRVATQLITFNLQKRGYLSLASSAGYGGVGMITDFAPTMADQITVTGMLDFSDQKMKALKVNEKPVVGEWPFANAGGDKMSSGIWHLHGDVKDPAKAVEVSNLSMTLSTVPNVSIAATDMYAQALSPADTAAFTVSRDLITSTPLVVSFRARAGSTAKGDDLMLLTRAGSAIKGGKVTIPAHQRSATIMVQAKSPRASKLILEIAAGAGYTAASGSAEIEILAPTR